MAPGQEEQQHSLWDSNLPFTTLGIGARETPTRLGDPTLNFRYESMGRTRSISSAVNAARQSVMEEGGLPAENQLDSPPRASRTSGRLSPCINDCA